MKKRIRKKKHVGEFAKFGTVIIIKAIDGNNKKVLDSLRDIAERHGLVVWGGDAEHFLIPHLSNTYAVPKLVELLIIAIVEKPDFFRPDELNCCVYSPKDVHVPDAFMQDFKTRFDGPEYKYGLREDVNLWRK